MIGRAKEDINLDAFPIHRACRDGDVEALMKFIQVRCNTRILSAEDHFYHWTPMHWACYFGQLPALIVLREAGIGVDITTTQFHQTPAHIAAFAGADHCLKYLVHFGCNVNRQDYMGETPLHKAARTGFTSCCRVLAEAAALPTVARSGGHTPAQLAAVCGHLHLAEMINHYQLQTGGGGPPPPAQEAVVPPTAGLNGGLVPPRSGPAAGHWCYQPPTSGVAMETELPVGWTAAAQAQKRSRDEVVFEEFKRRRMTAGEEAQLCAALADLLQER